MRTLSTPDFTPGALATWAFVLVTNAALLFGLSIDGDKKAALMIVLNSVAVAAFFIHDAVIRSNRAKAEAIKAAAGANPANPEGYLPPE